MAKTGNMPTRLLVAQRATALALLVSFAACSHGSEPRVRPADEAPRQPVPAVSAAQEPRAEVSAQAKRGVIRSAEPVPAPDAIAAGSIVSAVAGSSSAGANASRAAAPASLDALPHPGLDSEKIPVARTKQMKPVDMQPLRATSAPQAAPAPNKSASDWVIYAGAGAAAVLLLVLALLLRRNRKAAQQKRDADDLRTQELVRTEVQRVREQELLEAQERAVEEERARAVAEAAALAAVQHQRQQQADVATVREHVEKKVDPRIEAAHRLFDLLHQAERDVEPFLRLLDAAVPNDAASTEARGVVASWHEAMLGTRNRLSEALARHNAPVDLHPVEPAADLQGAVSRLIDHAARMNALMIAQQQQNSAILHWSRLLPGALVQLFWRAQTAKYSTTMTQLPKVPDAPAPGAAPAQVPAPAPAPVAAQALRPVRTHDKAIQQALRGAQRHATSA